MAAETNAVSRCKACIDAKKSFLLQGGAGSGKTESLKELLLYVKQTQPDASVVCITHTNAAVDEIAARVGDDYFVSTIHSFLYNLIRNYRKNIKQVIPTLFQMEHILPDCTDHNEYKRLYKQYKRKRYELFEETSEEVVPKRAYDKNPSGYNQSLNQQIGELNGRLSTALVHMELPENVYNETHFNSFRDPSFGHDGLLIVFHALFNRYPLFRKILRDKYDYIFIDEYQDTNGDILHDLLKLPTEGGTAVCLFGDHMQSIYDRGIDDLDSYIANGKLENIPKEDNFRCSFEVIELINSLRTDGIKQQVALKAVNGHREAEVDRHGSARVWYAIADSKPGSKSSDEEKQRHHQLLEKLVDQARKSVTDPANCKVLILTNKEIATQNGFSQLYKIFSERYADAKDRIENYLRKIQALDVAELCLLYERKQYNELIGHIKKNGYDIRTGRDVTRLRELMENMITNPDRSIWQTVELAVSQKLIRQTEACEREFSRSLLDETDSRYTEFYLHYHNGHNTYTKQKKVWDITSQEEFDSLNSKRKKAQFYQMLFSDAVKFKEVRDYCAYLNELTDYITMHKTKGTSIQSVVVVMDEFFWTEYDFGLIYAPVSDKADKQTKSEKLIYVACSRARKDLVCIRILTASEEDAFKAKFPQAEKIHITEFVSD